MCKFVFLFFALVGGSQAFAEDSFWSDFKFGADAYGSHSHLVTYKGTQDDLSASFKLRYPDFKIQLFTRFSASNYSYLNESIPNNTAYTDEHRTAAGIGLDFFILPALRIRYIADNITNKVTNNSYQQEAYIIIYNQYIDLDVLQVNNYLEAAVIPRLSTEKFNTYFRTQFLKTIDLNRTNETSNSLFPFVQFKVRDNEEQLFGASGSNASLGLGYKHYTRIDGRSSYSLLLEAHSLAYQSPEFNADWNQLVAALQYTFN